MFFFQPGMVSAPWACSGVRSLSGRRLRGSPRLLAHALRPVATRPGLLSGAGAPRRLPDTWRRRQAPRCSPPSRRSSPGWQWRWLAAGPGRALRGQSGRGGRRVSAAAVARCGREAGGPEQAGAGPPSPRRWAPAGAQGWRRLAPLLLLLASFFPFLVPPPPAGGTRSRRGRTKLLRAGGTELRAPGAPVAGASPPRRARGWASTEGRARSHPPRPGRRPARLARPARYGGWHPAAAAEPSPAPPGPPAPSRTGRSGGFGDDLDEAGGSVLPSSPSFLPLPTAPRPACRPLPQVETRSSGFANFALNIGQ